MKFGLWLIAVCAFCVVQAADYSRVAADVSALSADKGFVGEMLKKRVEARTAPSDAAKTLAVRFALDDAIKGENAVVTVKNGTAAIRAGRFRGLVFGAGLLLRTARYAERSFSLADGEYRFEPKKSLRMCYMARHFLNWYHLATPEELTTYIDDLALSGHNAFKVQCELPTPGKNGNFEKASLAVVNRVHALDCGFCSGGGSNQAPEDSPEELRGVPNSDPKRGNLGFNVCISKPGGMDYLCRLRKGQIEKLAGSNSDYFCYWPFDEGGCECDGCKPWGGNGFLRLIERFRAMNNAAFPNAKTIISTWVFHDDDWEGLYKWLETHDGVDYILADSHTDFPKYPLEHPTPKGIPIMTFPEISMWGRAPWGGYGATALPKRFTRLFRQVERIADGFMSYSEGLYEDINKEVVNALYINPSADTDDILRAYAAYYFPGTDPEDFVKLCDIFETNHKFPGDHSHPSFKGVAPDSPELAEYRSRAAEACRIVERMEKAILPAFRNDWRWRLVYLRAMIDREILATRQGAPESARKYFEELVTMYHAEQQLAGWRKTGKRGWTTPQFGSGAEFAETPVELKNAGFHETDGKGGAVGWSHHPNWHAEKAGHNGSGALVWECASENEVTIGGPGQEVKLKPGKRYEFSAIFKPDGVVTQRKSIYQGLTLYVEGYDANGKWMFGDMARPPAAGKSDDWVKVEGMTREIPEGVAKAYFRVIAKRCVSGRGAVDNVYLAERETVAVEGVFPHVYRRESTGGPVRFSASINADVHENKLEDYTAEFTYVAGGEKKTVSGEVVSPVEAVVALDTSLFAFGTNDVTCTLYLRGKELGSAAVPFAHLAKPTPRRVYIDRHLRTIVDGKPFFPFGMCYWGDVTKEGLERYAEGPFNCVNTDWSMQPEQLELCREKGLLAICGLEKGFDEPDEGKSWLVERVNAMKDHPTVMGWFVSDEQPIADILKMRRRQGWMETLDPDHPTWFALDTVREARHYLGTADVMGLDPYPIPTKPIGLVHSTTCRGVTNTFGAMANWQFPQAFGWGWLKRRETKGQRAPTQKEMANMGWQAIAGGANGLIFYAYQHLSEPHDDPEDAFEPAWARTKAMAEEFKKYIDVFLSIEPAPTAESSNSDVAVRTWRYNGDTYILAVNCTTNAQTATIRLSETLGEVVAADFAPAPEIDGQKVHVSLDPISYLMLRTKKAVRVFAQDREVFVHDANYDTSAIGRHLGYVRRAGSHGLSAYDWTWLMDFADGVFGADSLRKRL